MNLPYPDSHGFAKVNASTLRGNFPRMDSSPLGVVNIRIKTVEPDSDPATLVYRYLKMFFTPQPDQLVYGLQEFEITANDSDTLENHRRNMDDIVAKMERYVYHHQCRFDDVLT